MASFSLPPDLALLHAIARRDLPAVEGALASGAKTQWKSVTALHLCALCGWAEPVPQLLAHGANANALLLECSDAELARLEALGVPEDLCAAVVNGRWNIAPLDEEEGQTPLALAVCCRAAAVATALLAAGGTGGLRGAYPQLVELAAWKAEKLGPQAAAATVPALVQQCAAALLAVPLLPGPALEEAHEAAAQLAFPRSTSHPPHCDSYPACPWLLQRLLQQHQAGQMLAPQDGVWAACRRLLVCAAERERLPAALPAVLSLAPVPAMLRREAEQPLVLGGPQDGTAAELVCSAALNGRAELLDAVLAAGGAVTLNAIRSTATNFDDPRTLRSLQLLLSRGRPPVPLDGAVLSRGLGADEIGRCFTACTMYAVLDTFVTHINEMCEEALDGTDGTGLPPSEQPFHDSHKRALAVMDCLADAGYRPSTFRNYPLARLAGGQWEIYHVPTYSPAHDAPPSVVERWELSTSSRWLWLAARREPWIPESHAAFPRAFQQAARTLLLAAHRGAKRADGAHQAAHRRRRRAAASAAAAHAGAAQLARLPRELLHAILAHAAYPVSAWKPWMDGGRVLQQVRESYREFIDEMLVEADVDDGYNDEFHDEDAWMF